MTIDRERMPYRPCVGIMLLNDKGQVFVARRIDTMEAWQMPQGGIEHGENAREAALRELKEEIGTDRATVLAEMPHLVRYDFPDHILGRVLGGRYRGQEQRWVAARFTGRDSDIDIATEHPEFDQWRWVEIDQLVTLIVPFKRETYRQVVGHFRPLLAQLMAPELRPAGAP